MSKPFMRFTRPSRATYSIREGYSGTLNACFTLSARVNNPVSWPRSFEHRYSVRGHTTMHVRADDVGTGPKIP